MMSTAASVNSAPTSQVSVRRPRGDMVDPAAVSVIALRTSPRAAWSAGAQPNSRVASSESPIENASTSVEREVRPAGKLGVERCHQPGQRGAAGDRADRAAHDGHQ